MNPSDSPEPAMPAVNPITRRSFMKKTALSTGAITLLGQGIGFANPHSSCELDGTFNHTGTGSTPVLDSQGNLVDNLNTYIESDLSGPNGGTGPWASPKSFKLTAKATFKGKTITRQFIFTGSCATTKVAVSQGNSIPASPASGSDTVQVGGVTYTITLVATPDYGDNFAKLKDVKATVSAGGASTPSTVGVGTQNLIVHKHTP